MKENTDNDFENVAIFILAGGVVAYKFVEKIDWKEITYEFISGLDKAIVFTSLFLSFCLFSVLVYGFNKRKAGKESDFIGQIRQFLEIKHLTLNDLKSKEKETSNLCKQEPKLAKKHSILVKSIRNNLKKRINELKNEENRKIEEGQFERAQRLEEQETIQRLQKYFEERNSADSIPEWALEYNSKIIEEAVEKFDNSKRKKEEIEENWQEIIRFVLEKKAFPIDFNKIGSEKQFMYRKALRLLKKGVLEQELKERVNVEKQEQFEIIEDEKLPIKRFYHANELSAKEREELVSKHRYMIKNFIFKDGSPGNNLIIKNDGKSESDYHFCMKHLFGEIDKKNSKMEYLIGDFRADVAFVYDNYKIAVEVETGNNKQIQIENKVDWLNTNFDYWVFVCSRKNKSIYKKYVDNKKSFCLTLKDADEKVQQLLADFCSSKPAAAY